MKILKNSGTTIPDKDNSHLAVIPLRDMVLLPDSAKSFYVGRKESINAVEKALKDHDKQVIVVTQTNTSDSVPEESDIYKVGVIAEIIEVKPTPDKKVIKVNVVGKDRVSIIDFTNVNDYLSTKYEILPDIIEHDSEKIELLRSLILKEFKNFIDITKSPHEILKNLSITTNNELINIIIGYLGINVNVQIELLTETSLEKRLTTTFEIILTSIENIQLEKKITLEVKKRMEKSQKDFYLNEQIKEIQKELGINQEDGDFLNTEDFIKKMESINIPETVKSKLIKEQKRFSKMPPMSQESGLIRNYIDTFFELPWNNRSMEPGDLNTAKDILNKEHYSLTKVKNRILEFLAVRKLNPETKGPILCFVGPPGTGKTSLAKSVATAIEREFVRISLGGIRDEAEIRGHRRTYLGALPGKIIQSMKKVKSINPVFLLDEIDKMSSDFRGDPASALLEVLDPEQNSQFSDHFLEIPYNLSEVMFICTANSMQGIPYPLLDRMEIINISSYTEQEKMKITENFIIPKQVKENGISDVKLNISSKAIIDIIRHYTMEAGVRSLQRQVATICRKIAKQIVLSSTKPEKLNVTQKNLHKYLGKKKYSEPSIYDFLDYGVCHGLAWSELGGAILPIEIVLYPGSGKITLTGKLGDVMKESAQTAFSYIKANAHLYDIKYTDFYKDFDLHIHFPEGATPKDGPSAGIAITTGILSALTKTSVSASFAMTGEITLTGKVLAIGGLKEKTLAAIRHNKKIIILPADNDKDISELPKTVKDKLEFKYVKRADEVFKIIFDKSIYLTKNQGSENGEVAQ